MHPYKTVIAQELGERDCETLTTLCRELTSERSPYNWFVVYKWGTVLPFRHSQQTKFPVLVSQPSGTSPKTIF
jgi:hypothetical protein